jgi:tripartite-type tricarboxylate transporter receptor subunit TctC
MKFMSKNTPKRLARIVASFFLSSSCAMAQPTFPSKPITIVVPFPAGGTTDVIARSLQEPMQKILGQTVVVENKAGAAGLIGTKHVQAATPDGHTILMPNNGFLLGPLLAKNAGYNVETSFVPIGFISKQPLVLVAHPSVPASTLSEFISYAKRMHQKFEFATSGPLSFTTLSTILFNQRAGLDPLMVAYKGQGPSLQAVISGEVKALMNVSSPLMNSMVEAGRLKLIGVTSPEPTPLAPGATPIATAIPGFSVDLWFGLLAPEGTPPDAIKKLNEALNQSLAMADIQERLKSSGALPYQSSPEQMQEVMREEFQTWKTTLESANIKPE